MAAIAVTFPKPAPNASFVSFLGKQRAVHGVVRGKAGANGLQEKFSGRDEGGCWGLMWPRHWKRPHVTAGNLYMSPRWDRSEGERIHLPFGTPPPAPGRWAEGCPCRNG